MVTTAADLAPQSSRTSLKRSRILFDTSHAPSTDPLSTPAAASTLAFVPPLFDESIHKASTKRKIGFFYPDVNLAYQEEDADSKKDSATVRAIKELRHDALDRLPSGEDVAAVSGNNGEEGRLVIHREMDLQRKAPPESQFNSNGGAMVLAGMKDTKTSASAVEGKQPVRPGGILVIRKSDTTIPTPKWHAPWRLSTVISSHLGWVRSIAFDPTNTMFATGGGDRVIKIFDLAKACVAANDALKITLTGHISPVRGLAFSERHPYLFSAGEDKMVKVSVKV
jgi:WD40 repeat protein